MITTTPTDFLKAYGDGSSFPATGAATLRGALLVSPRGFALSEESAKDNRYMDASAPVDLARAHRQHQRLAAQLTDLGVPVLLFAGADGLADGVYPNNVFATTPGRLIVGRMKHAHRQAEAERRDIRDFFSSTLRYEVADLSAAPCVAELTGPLVIDRPRGIGFCGLSSRADVAGCEAMHEAFGLKHTFRFALSPTEYHTNLVLAVLAGRACVLHAPSFREDAAARAVAGVYGDQVVFLSDEEKAAFAGNCLAVTENDALFSQTALDALRPSTLTTFERAGFRLHGVELDELEKGGGSLRCLIAEIF